MTIVQGIRGSTAPESNYFQLRINSLGAAAVPSATSGTSITPGSNAYGNYASLIPGIDPGGGAPYVSHDVYGLWIYAVAGSVSTEARDLLLTIGVDPAGATTFVDKISHLICPQASPYLGASLAGGHAYYFPLLIPAGTSIGAKASVNHGTVRTVRAFVILDCRPTRPDLLRVGRTVTTFGAVTASSRGTAVTPGTVAEGDYVQLGSALTTSIFHWNLGIGCNSGAMENTVVHGDLALETGSTKRLVVSNRQLFTTSGEISGSKDAGSYADGVIGDKVYARLQQAGTLDVYSCAAYGVGP